ncbi:Sirohydrochlorin cobaltochelatase [Desulfofarcimen acetoxidans DSM 771]|uniref:Sirohydrochlorin cobaltochelatase n=1 Tax=Desulfofarcimen acetoxidans (strain ATCC 49208 / DSM 771 / KCTC 5769 / VKM B-1644 / 5575) TaxID=485916 RepID=C8W623_DESAS|nr:sirohydrochlorin cobaltochelatase [Desulfofarcimen acetoxidans]ACV61478.1 Sirohydrochlorin cobaltochelatase [Desulfofarcimen acetoxidans DSM 771]
MKRAISLSSVILVLFLLMGCSNTGKQNPTAQNTNPETEKKAILIVSFGTTYEDTRKLTIEAVENRAKEEFKGWDVRRAFSSHTIIKVLKERDGIEVDTPEQALQKLKNDGYTTVVVQMLNIIPGVEYDYIKKVVDQYKNDNSFKKISCGLPLLYYMGQENEPNDFITALEALKTQLPSSMKNDEALLVLAHGTPHPANAYYTVLQHTINELGFKNTYVYTVEGTPTLEEVIPQLKANNIKKITLIPFMLVAGDHANNDMAGEEKDSHTSQLKAEGFAVDSYLHGLGENKEIQNIYMNRIKQAMNELNSKPAGEEK